MNLKDTAYKVLHMVKKANPWKPNTDDIAREFRLDYEQARRVNKHVKRLAADEGLFYGWDPEPQHFRICPDNCPDVYARMMGYAHRHWAENGSGITTQITGATSQGYVSDEDSVIMVKRIREAQRIILSNVTQDTEAALDSLEDLY